MAYAYFKKALDIRRSGSAAIDLCSIAAGRAELYFELRLSPWDYAAGALIVEEAGGVVTTVEGGKISHVPCLRQMDAAADWSEKVILYRSVRIVPVRAVNIIIPPASPNSQEPLWRRK